MWLHEQEACHAWHASSSSSNAYAWLRPVLAQTNRPVGRLGHVEKVS
jgi:hypothetical protein